MTTREYVLAKEADGMALPMGHYTMSIDEAQWMLFGHQSVYGRFDGVFIAYRDIPAFQRLDAGEIRFQEGSLDRLQEGMMAAVEEGNGYDWETPVRVEEAPAEDDQGNVTDKVLIRYPDGSTYLVNADQLAIRSR